VYGGGRIDRLTGEIWPQPAIDDAVEMGDEDESESESSERWLRSSALARSNHIATWNSSLALSGTPGRQTHRCHRRPRCLPKVQRRTR